MRRFSICTSQGARAEGPKPLSASVGCLKTISTVALPTRSPRLLDMNVTEGAPPMLGLLPCTP